ncbi:MULTISPECIES: RNA-binding S4 domain-containing protein [Vibrio]|uniref:RNA-binding S4 domain-containing protein n=1 Tax=Vibrio cortegadensis TaxID=1328770 RepID=A0ABV4M9E7_9VIBR|nr:RNA-binding S4 domain-containing protein [Vibrio genomosp. F6]TKF18984.1 RNA-binding S4 domain-containing protein [Vibrio genomosp. F6]
MDQEQYEEEFHQEGEEIEIEAIGIDVSSQPIELYKVFKIANLVGGGGEAKHIISEGYVAVNGELETRKRRKMYDGDFFEFNQEYYVVVCDAPVMEEADEKAAKLAKKQQAEKEEVAKKAERAARKEKKKAEKAAQPKGKKAKQSKSVKQDKSNVDRDANSGRHSIDFF